VGAVAVDLRNSYKAVEECKIDYVEYAKKEGVADV